jgi:hypothetical protein
MPAYPRQREKVNATKLSLAIISSRYSRKQQLIIQQNGKESGFYYSSDNTMAVPRWPHSQ